MPPDPLLQLLLGQPRGAIPGMPSGPIGPQSRPPQRISPEARLAGGRRLDERLLNRREALTEEAMQRPSIQDLLARGEALSADVAGVTGSPRSDVLPVEYLVENAMRSEAGREALQEIGIQAELDPNTKSGVEFEGDLQNFNLFRLMEVPGSYRPTIGRERAERANTMRARRDSVNLAQQAQQRQGIKDRALRQDSIMEARMEPAEQRLSIIRLLGQGLGLGPKALDALLPGG